jgi:Glycosyl hydrolase family 26
MLFQVILFISSPVLSFYQPPEGKVWLSAWLDTTDVNITMGSINQTIIGDRPLKLNERLGIKVSSFQYAQNFPMNRALEHFHFPLDQMDETLTDAVVYLTVYPYKDNPLAPTWVTTDAEIQELADQIKNMTTRAWNPLQVLLRLAPEMNGNWFEYGMQPLKYVALWKRFHTIIKATEPNVAFVWSPNYSYGYPYGSQNGRLLNGVVTPDELAVLDTNNNGRYVHLFGFDINTDYRGLKRKVYINTKTKTLANDRFDNGDDAYLPYYPGDEYVDWVGLSFYWKGRNTVPPPGAYEEAINAGGFYNTYSRLKNKPMVSWVLFIGRWFLKVVPYTLEKLHLLLE